MTTSVGTSDVFGTSVFPLATEQHMTLVYSYNQNAVKMYLNGVLVNSATPASGATLQTLNDQNVWLGASQWPDPPLVGWIDEFRIYEGAFSDAQAAASDAAGPNQGLPATNPTNIVTSVSGNVLTLSWPADHLGWTLQVQTNTVGVGLRSTNWVTVLGSQSATSTNFSINRANGTVFYRLTY